MTNACVLGIGSYLPEKVVTNYDLEKLVDTSDEWITKRTGIKTRRIVQDQTTCDLAFKASVNCLESTQDFLAKNLDAIIVSTCTPEQRMPSVANVLQGKLNAINAFSFDINAACSGFLYALFIANSFIKTEQVSNVLVVAADTMSTIVNWQDRNTCVLFGDGAGAVLLAAEKKEDCASGIFYEKMYCDAALAGALKTNKDNKIIMDGRSVFEAAIKKLTLSIKNMLDQNNMSAQDIDYLIIHQANLRIIEAIAQRLGIKDEQLINTVDKFANTSAATIPITLDFAKKNNMLKKGNKIVLAAMGAGFTWGSCLLVL